MAGQAFRGNGAWFIDLELIPQYPHPRKLILQNGRTGHIFHRRAPGTPDKLAEPGPIRTKPNFGAMALIWSVLSPKTVKFSAAERLGPLCQKLPADGGEPG